MLDVLSGVLATLPLWLQDPARWKSLDITYDEPRVERLWTPHLVTIDGVRVEYRVNLHRLHTCSKPLFHPHPWPSAVFLVQGAYEMEMGFGAGTEPPLVMSRHHMTAGDSYSMEHPDAWHSVRPLMTGALSVMVTGQPWSRPSFGKGHTHKSLAPEIAEELFHLFSRAFPPPGRPRDTAPPSPR